MANTLVSYLVQRPDAATFLLPFELRRALDELFPGTLGLLPQPYKIFQTDESIAPAIGFPLAESAVLKDLEVKLERWIADEASWLVGRDQKAKERSQLSFQLYVTHVIRVAENALVSNLLNDYHAVFWLAHSFDLARHFSGIPRRISMLDTQVGRTQGDALKYRIYARWSAEIREHMQQLAARTSAMLDGEEQRGVRFIRLLQDNLLLLTEEFIGPDLRELRSFVSGYLRSDFNVVRDNFEKLKAISADLLQKDRTFRSALTLAGSSPEQGVTVAHLLDPHFQTFLFDQPSVQSQVTREDREVFVLVAKRVREFAVLNQLRRGIVWMTVAEDGAILPTDRRNPIVYSRSTRPLDFGRSGVLDPMVHRFGLIYDISAFSETLGNIRRGGGKEEIRSYRQMLLFQHRLEAVAERQSLQFEKFLGDGAFYTTRRAIRLVRAAIEIQRFYSDMKRKGFAFNKGLRVAVNYGYYRLLPMKTGADSERITEFYGPGIVELSRLTTGKANKEIEDVAALLIAHGYDERKVRQFFAPLSSGVDTVDPAQHAREFYSYVNANGHLINEGIVASFWFLQELSAELEAEKTQFFRLKAPWGRYIGFAPNLPGVDYVGIRLLGMAALKGIDKIDVGEVTPFVPGTVEAEPIKLEESFLMLLRQEYHQHPTKEVEPYDLVERSSTTERVVDTEIVVCLPSSSASEDDEILIGEWDPLSDRIDRPLRMPRGDFQRLFSMKGPLTEESLASHKQDVRELYDRLCDRVEPSNIHLADFRLAGSYDTFVLGDVVEKL